MTHPTLERWNREEPAFDVARGFAAVRGATVWLVGGAVRDALMGRPTKDFDFVVGGLSAADLERELRRLGEVSLVGRSFGVFKLKLGDDEVDVALPRRETYAMTGGARDVEAQSDPAMPIEKDLARRDFTINAMAWNSTTHELVDPHGGQKDLIARRLRAVGEADERFREDYSRMLRGLRFAAQLGFEFEPSTWNALRARMPRINDEHDGRRLVPHELVARELLKSLAADPEQAAWLWVNAEAVEQIAPELGERWPDAVRTAQLRLEEPDVARVLNERSVPDSVRLGVCFAHLGALHGAELAERLKLASAGFGVDAEMIRKLAGSDISFYRALGARALVGGVEIMHLLDLRPGTAVGRLMDLLILAQGQGKVARREDAIEYLMSLRA